MRAQTGSNSSVVVAVFWRNNLVVLIQTKAEAFAKQS